MRLAGHRVVTVERQGGYAARCEVVVGGVVQLCDITFGGFPTRTAARAALVHGMAQVMAEENAPDAVQSVEGLAPRKGTD